MNSSFDFQPTNPFSTSCISPSQVVYRFGEGAGNARSRTVDAHLEALLAQLRNSRRSVIVGPHGTGKSTLLHTFLPKLQAAFPKVSFHQLSNDPSLGITKRVSERLKNGKRIRDELLELPKGGLLVVDGWEQLMRSSRWRITKSAVARRLLLLSTCHHRLSGWTLLHETKSTPKLIRSLAGDLLNDSPHEIRQMVDGDLKNRNLTATTNVRDLWFEMYDKVEDANSRQTKFNG